QLLDRNGADRIDAVHVASAGIDVDQPLPQLHRIGLLAFRAVENGRVRLRGCDAGHAQHQHSNGDRPYPLPHRFPPARSGNAAVSPSRVAFSTPRSVISPVTSRARVTST